MADISVLARLLNGAMRNVDLTNNTPVVLSVKIGGGVSNTELTKAILDRLVSLQDGSDVGTGYHTHDTVYTRTTALASSTSSSGSDLIGDDNTYSNFTPAAATVKGALSGIDTALTTAGGRVKISGTDTTADYLNPSLLVGHALTKTINNGGANETLTLAVDDTAISHSALANLSADDHTQYILADGTRAFTGNQSLGGNKFTNSADPSGGQDLVTLSYMNARLNGLTPKAPARVATTGNITLSGAQTIDGISIVAGNRVLVKDQTAPEENGIYVASASAWSRAADMDSLTPFDEFNGAWTSIQQGTQAGQVYVQYGTVTTVGTDPVNFAYYNPIAGLIGGDMITFAGSTFSVDLASTSGLESSNPGNVAGQLRVKLEASNPSLKITGSNELAAKLDVAGAIASGASGLAAQVDNSTIEISSNALRVKDTGITLAKLAANSVDENKIVSTSFNAAGAVTGGSGSKIAVQVDASSIEISSNALRVKSTAYDQSTITGGSGSAAAVQSAPLMRRSLVAGEAFAANTSFLVRWALTGETAGRVYKADKDASSSNKYMAIGIALSTGSVSAGGSITVIMMGEHTLGSSDTPFSSGDVGKELFVGSSGAFILGAALANTTNEAQYCVGVVQDTSKIWIDAKQLRGIA